MVTNRLWVAWRRSIYGNVLIFSILFYRFVLWVVRANISVESNGNPLIFFCSRCSLWKLFGPFLKISRGFVSDQWCPVFPLSLHHQWCYGGHIMTHPQFLVEQNSTALDMAQETTWKISAQLIAQFLDVLQISMKFKKASLPFTLHVSIDFQCWQQKSALKWGIFESFPIRRCEAPPFERWGVGSEHFWCLKCEWIVMLKVKTVPVKICFFILEWRLTLRAASLNVVVVVCLSLRCCSEAMVPSLLIASTTNTTRSRVKNQDTVNLQDWKLVNLQEQVKLSSNYSERREKHDEFFVDLGVRQATKSRMPIRIDPRMIMKMFLARSWFVFF